MRFGLIAVRFGLIAVRFGLIVVRFGLVDLKNNFVKIGLRSWILPYVLVWKLERIGWYSTVSLIIQSSCVINSLPNKNILQKYCPKIVLRSQGWL